MQDRFYIKRDIRKLADWLVERAQEGIAVEKKVLEWKLDEQRKVERGRIEQSKAS